MLLFLRESDICNIYISQRTSVFIGESTSQFFIKNNYIKLVNCTTSDSQSRYGKKKIQLRLKKKKQKISLANRR